MLDRSHPYWHVQKTVFEVTQIFKINFSYYHYRPKSFIDERMSFTVTRTQFLNPDFVYELIKNCPRGSDLAFHSNFLLIDGNFWHLPMVDMSTSSQALLRRLEIAPSPTLRDLFWFFSGRSFHGYGRTLISSDDWPKYMGELLLFNEKDMRPLVDPRWVGHRLISGYSALRWSFNTTHYLNYPKALFPS